MSDHRVIFGNVEDVLRGLPAGSVDCVFTSPPYFGLRDYRVPGQIGLEATPEEYVARLVRVFAEVRRVLADHGTLAVNLGDSYARDALKGGSGPNGKHDYMPDYGNARRIISETRGSSDGLVGRGDRAACRVGGAGLKPKDLCGIPWRVAFALQADGWYLRSDIIWAKGISGEATRNNGWCGSVMPESVRDRPTNAHEHIFLLSKAPRYWYDHYAVQEDSKYPAGTKAAKGSNERKAEEGVNARPAEYATYSGKRNLRNVVTVSPRGFKGAHFAVFPLELPLMFLPAMCPPRVCSRCGKPWEHRVKKTGNKAGICGGEHRETRRNGGLGPGRPRDYDAEAQIGMGRDLGYFRACACHGRDLCSEVTRALKSEDDEALAAIMAERDAIPDDTWRPGTVLDPFLGSGTVTEAARKLGVNSVGIELNRDYEAVMRERFGTLLSLEGRIVFEHHEEAGGGG